MKKYLFAMSAVILTMGLATGCSVGNTTNGSSEKVSTTKSLKNQAKITVRDATDIYQQTFPETDIISVELKKTLGKPIYTIEGADSTTEYQLDINAINKKIKQKSEEPLDEDDINEAKTKKIDFDQVISLKKAAQIAENKVENGQSTEFKLEKEHEITTWEVKVKDTEVTINAKTGKVIKTEDD